MGFLERPGSILNILKLFWRQLIVWRCFLLLVISLFVLRLSRMRSVCKTWNELIARPRFHDLCDLNGKNNVYLFMWREDLRYEIRGVIEPGTLGILDLDAWRWYSIEAIMLPRVCACGNEIETRFMALDDGLVCELTTSRGTDNNFALTLSDPVAKTRRILPAPPRFYSTQATETLPYLVTVVDDIAGSYKVFLLNNLFKTPGWESLPRVYVYESITNEWRGERNLPNGVGGMWAMSAVVLHQTVFVGYIHENSDYDKVTILSYKHQEDTWAEVWRMSFHGDIRHERFVVGDNRLFLILWVEHPSSDPDCPNSESLFHTDQDDPGKLFEMYEILIAENARKPVVQLTEAQLQHIFGSHYFTASDVACGYPCFDSNGMCNSVVLVSTCTGQIRRHYLETGSVDVLPPHPSVQTSEEPDNSKDYYYDARNMKLSLRNVLAQRPTTLNLTGWRLLQ